MSEPSRPTELTTDSGYQQLLGRISEVYTTGQMRAQQAVNAHITETCWQIGHDIVEYEQEGKVRAEYGKALLATLSRDLTLRHGKGFSRSNLVYMRLLYLNYPISQKPSDLLSWSHYVELLRIDDKLERSFYEENLQEGRAAYGKQILATVSRELTAEYGNGFTLRSLYRSIQFSQAFPNEEIVSALSTQLSWSHFMELLPIKDPLARDFYAEMCRIERWDVRTFRKKIGGMLFERTALSKNSAEVISAEIVNLRDDPKRCGKANCLSSPHRGSNKSAQGKATRPKPQSAALGSDPQAEQALKGRNNESVLIGTISGVIASRLCRPFRARPSVVRGPRAALRGEGRYALPWADLWWPFRPVESDADCLLKQIGGLSK